MQTITEVNQEIRKKESELRDLRERHKDLSIKIFEHLVGGYYAMSESNMIKVSGNKHCDEDECLCSTISIVKASENYCVEKSLSIIDFRDLATMSLNKITEEKFMLFKEECFNSASKFIESGI